MFASACLLGGHPLLRAVCGSGRVLFREEFRARIKHYENGGNDLRDHSEPVHMTLNAWVQHGLYASGMLNNRAMVLIERHCAAFLVLSLLAVGVTDGRRDREDALTLLDARVT